MAWLRECEYNSNVRFGTIARAHLMFKKVVIQVPFKAARIGNVSGCPGDGEREVEAGPFLYGSGVLRRQVDLYDLRSHTTPHLKHPSPPANTRT